MKSLASAPWVSTVPGIAIIIVSLSFNYLGDGLRVALDPRLRNRH
jgi:peptide/nickel transport system permease protein